MSSEGDGARRAVTVRGAVAGVVGVGVLAAGAVWWAAPRDEPMVTSGAEADWAASVIDPVEAPSITQLPPGELLLAQASGLLREARSVRVAADIRKGTQHIRLDVRMDREENCAGDFDAGPGQRGHLVALAGKEPEAYMKFSATALNELQGMANTRGTQVADRMRQRIALMRGKYLKAPSGPKGAKSLAELCTLAHKMGENEDVEGTKALKPVQHGGRRMVPLVPAPESGEEGMAYVDAGAKPYLRSLRATDKDMTADVKFSEYDRPLTVRRPAASEIVRFEDGGSMFAV
ncbi:hypothetical protein [Streptomyces sp. NPDC102360]|uniref:hypothetical protein n=1 Tax=Streptomyces sp. NPDC102360 TaxID=3366160 RepID=UPI00380CC3AB